MVGVASAIAVVIGIPLGVTLTEGFMAVDGSPGKLYALAAPVELDIGGVAVRDVSFAVLARATCHASGWPCGARWAGCGSARMRW
ncbi:hypothetical protein G6F40_015697 [Rhizopus arrhizus]|nr:hypothetical protein G6F40_015697 [Rhizopus arrhizus]